MQDPTVTSILRNFSSSRRASKIGTDTCSVSGYPTRSQSVTSMNRAPARNIATATGSDFNVVMVPQVVAIYQLCQISWTES